MSNLVDRNQRTLSYVYSNWADHGFTMVRFAISACSGAVAMAPDTRFAESQRQLKKKTHDSFELPAITIEIDNSASSHRDSRFS